MGSEECAPKTHSPLIDTLKSTVSSKNWKKKLIQYNSSNVETLFNLETLDDKILLSQLNNLNNLESTHLNITENWDTIC